MEKKDRIKKDISRESYLQTVIRRFKQHHLATVSLVILAVLVVAALLAPITHRTIRMKSSEAFPKRPQQSIGWERIRSVVTS